MEEEGKTMNSNAFVLGISGGDCAGKKELIQYMFKEKNGEFFMKDSDERVTSFTKTTSSRIRSIGLCRKAHNGIKWKGRS